eukprot:SAG22_NODE_494_length_9810_cov_2.202966_6_plen_106_part_00
MPVSSAVGERIFPGLVGLAAVGLWCGVFGAVTAWYLASSRPGGRAATAAEAADSKQNVVVAVCVVSGLVGGVAALRGMIGTVEIVVEKLEVWSSIVRHVVGGVAD